MSNDFRIEKERCQVIVTTIGGEQIEGDVFLQPYSGRHSGPEAPADMLNGDEAFFPLALEDGEMLLLAKRQLLLVEVPSEAPGETSDDVALAGVRTSPVEVTLVGGERRTGSVRLELPYERPRLLDFLNRFRLAFLPLYTDAGVQLVNRRCIERVRPLD